MLLDIWSVLGGIGLAAVAFMVVILVCVVILRLLAAILPSYEDRDARAAGPDEGVPEEPAGEVQTPGAEKEAGAPEGEKEAPADEDKRAPTPDDVGPG